MKELNWNDLHEMGSLKGIIDFLEPHMAFSLIIAMDLSEVSEFDKNIFLISLLVGFDNLDEISKSDGFRTSEFAEYIYNNYVSKLSYPNLMKASLMYAKSIHGADVNDLVKSMEEK